MPEEINHNYPMVGTYSPLSSGSDSAVDCNTAPHTPEVAFRIPYPVLQCPRPQCTSLSFLDHQSLLRHDRETHSTFRAEVFKPHCEGSEGLEALEAALSGWIAVDHPTQSQNSFGDPIFSDPLILGEDDGLFSQMSSGPYQSPPTGVATSRRSEGSGEIALPKYSCLSPGCEKLFPRESQLQDHVARIHSQLIWVQPEGITAPSRQQPLHFPGSSGSPPRLPPHDARGTDGTYIISSGVDNLQPNRVLKGSDIPRYFFGPTEKLPVKGPWNITTHRPGYRSYVLKDSRTDPEPVFAPLASYPTSGSKRKPAFIEDIPSRSASSDSGVFPDSHQDQRKERKISHHQDLSGVEGNNELQDEDPGDFALTLERHCPYLESIRSRGESCELQNQLMGMVAMWSPEDLLEPRESSELRRQSPMLPSDNISKSHVPCGIRRRSLEPQNVASLSISPPNRNLDSCSTLDMLKEQHTRLGSVDGVPRTPLHTKTQDPLPGSCYEESTEHAKNSGDKEIVTPKKASPQPYSPEQLSMWMGLLPDIQRDYAKIMGADNNGSIQLLNKNGQGVISVTCRYPKRVRMHVIKKLLSSLNLEIETQKGSIRRSDQRNSYEWPAIHGHHTVQPSPGASLGVSEVRNLESSVSLGGYIMLLKPGSQDWQWYATTSHHLLEDGIDTASDWNSDSDDSDENEYHNEYVDSGEDGGEDEGEDGEEEPAGSENVETLIKTLTPGVRDGILHLPDNTTRTFEIQSPSKVYLDHALGRLKERRKFVELHPGHNGLEDIPQLDTAIGDLKRAETFFGNVHESSGLCIDGDKQMDWLLIGHIPRERIGSNDSRDWSSFLEGVPRGSRSQPSPRSTFVSKSKFDKLTSAIKLYYDMYLDKYCPFSRIHGSGCESGLSDGQLLVPPVVVQLNNMAPTIEWTFKPRRNNGLGTFGDSGTWLYTTNGELLGQVLGYDPRNDVAFYTPIHLIFDHIKKHTEATNLQLPTKEDYEKQQFVKPSPLSIPMTPRTPSTTHITARSMPTPPEDPLGYGMAGPTMHPLVWQGFEHHPMTPDTPAREHDSQ